MAGRSCPEFSGQNESVEVSVGSLRRFTFQGCREETATKKQRAVEFKHIRHPHRYKDTIDFAIMKKKNEIKCVIKSSLQAAV